MGFLKPAKTPPLPPIAPVPPPAKLSTLEVQDAEDAVLKRQAKRTGYQSTLLSQPTLGGVTEARKSILG